MSDDTLPMVRSDYPVAVRAKAYDLFLSSGLSLREIGIELAIPESTLMGWYQEEKWRDRKRALEVALYEDAEAKYRKFLIENKLPTVERHLKAAKAIEEKVIEQIDTIQPGAQFAGAELQRVAKALSDAANVSARAAAITDRPMNDAQEQEKEGKQKRRPLVAIGVQVVAPEGSKVEVKATEVGVE